jgi:hypothetical protein
MVSFFLTAGMPKAKVEEVERNIKNSIAELLAELEAIQVHSAALCLRYEYAKSLLK